jgi:hypothetical protein
MPTYVNLTWHFWMRCCCPTSLLAILKLVPGKVIYLYGMKVTCICTSFGYVDGRQGEFGSVHKFVVLEFFQLRTCRATNLDNLSPVQNLFGHANSWGSMGVGNHALLQETFTFQDTLREMCIVPGCDNSGFLVVPDCYANVNDYCVPNVYL